MTVYDQIEKVSDADSFIVFLNSLAKDYRDNHDEWENWNIDAYLESISAWLNASKDSHGNGEFEQLDFNALAKLFYVGKIYE